MATPDGTQELLSSASIRLVYGRRYGLIGRNGIGKSTLLTHIANYELPGFPTHLRVVHVEQEVRRGAQGHGSADIVCLYALRRLSATICPS